MTDDGIDPVPVPVYKNKRIVAYAAVDARHAPLVLRYRWQLHQKGYAARSTRGRGGKVRHFYLHREVYRLSVDNPDAASPPSVDHLNGIKLDCRTRNLDGVTVSENSTRATPGKRLTREAHDPAPDFVGRVYTDADLPPF